MDIRGRGEPQTRGPSHELAHRKHARMLAAETQSVNKKVPAASVSPGLPLNSIMSIEHMSEKVADIEEEPLTCLDGRGRMRILGSLRSKARARARARASATGFQYF